MSSWAAIVQHGIGLASSEIDRTPIEVWEPLGYVPVSGTLNLKCRRPLRQAMRKLASTLVWTPAPGKQPTAFFPISVNGYSCHARALETTIEVIAPVRLREHLQLVDGQTVRVALR